MKTKHLFLILALLCMVAQGAWAAKKPSDFNGSGTKDDPYIISNITKWQTFVSRVNGGQSYSGKYFKQTGNFTINSSDQIVSTSGAYFKGTYDGNGRHITFENFSYDDQFLAPFRRINGATIKNLVIQGTFRPQKKFAGGVAGYAIGTNTIENCRIEATFTPSDNWDESGKDVSLGGVVGEVYSGTTTIKGCAFVGKLTGSSYNSAGGFVGWTEGNNSAKVKLTDCVFKPQEVNMTSVNDFARTRNAGDVTTSRCYYYTPVTTNQGTRIYKINQGERVNITALNGNTTSYDKSGLTFYSSGLKIDNDYYAASNAAVTLTMDPDFRGYTFERYTATTGTLADETSQSPTLTMGNDDTTIAAVYTENNLTQDTDDAYVIANVDDWHTFCVQLEKGNYTGATLKLTGNVSGATMMAGTSTYKFSGTFDGQGHTLNINYSTKSSYCAPFRYINGATIRNLNVDGSISTSGQYAAGIVASANGTNTITDCKSGVALTNYLNGDGTHGGLVAIVNDGTTTISGCIFNGSMLGEDIINCGGFVGWTYGTLNITNGLFAPTTIDNIDGGTYQGNKTFYRANKESDVTFTNCYYTQTFGDAQGSPAVAGDIILQANADNSTVLAENNGKLVNATLNGTTLYRDGKVQTICLPFDVTDFTDTPLDGFTVLSPASGEVMPNTTDTYIIRCSEATSITAHKPYILKWESAAADAIANPVFNNVVIAAGSPEEVVLGNNDVSLCGTYNVKSIGGADYSVTTDGTVSNAAATVNALQVFIHNYKPETYTQIRLRTTTSITPGWSGSGTEDDPYIIANNADFAALANYVEDGESYNGKHFKMTADIGTTDNPVSAMVGSDANHPFRGNFNGNGHTLTVGYDTSNQYAAPFQYTYGATIRNLKTAGTITASSEYAGGVVGRNGTGSLTLYNVTSSVTINSSKSGNAYHGGLVGYTINASIERCSFTGKLLGESSQQCGGLLGYKSNTNNSNVTITNCLFKPEQVTIGTTGSYTFGGGSFDKVTVTDSYYTQTFGTAQGTQAYTISCGTENVWLYYGALVAGEDDETIAELEYRENEIFVFDTGLLFQKVFYTGGTTAVTFMPLTNEYGKEVTGVAASAGTLTNNGDGSYKLAMNNNNSVVTATIDDIPGITLYDGTHSPTNATTITDNEGTTKNVTISERKLYKDGYWNTLCLPFDVTAEQIAISSHPLYGATIMELDIEGTYDTDKQTGFVDGTLYLYFKDATKIDAGKPYLVKWETTGDPIFSPEFNSSTIEDSTPGIVESADGKVQFIGNFDPETLDGGDASNFYLGSGNQLFYPSADKPINSFRGYFHVNTSAGVRAFVLNFGDDGETTGIVGIEQGTWNMEHSAGTGWYDLSGRKLAKKPTSKGIYIYNGKKRIIK